MIIILIQPGNIEDQIDSGELMKTILKFTAAILKVISIPVW